MFLSRLPSVVLGVVVLGCGRVAEHPGPSDGGADGGRTSDGGAPNTYTTVIRSKSEDKMDILFVIENSPSMADKQTAFRCPANQRHVLRLVGPVIDVPVLVTCTKSG